MTPIVGKRIWSSGSLVSTKPKVANNDVWSLTACFRIGEKAEVLGHLHLVVELTFHRAFARLGSAECGNVVLAFL